MKFRSPSPLSASRRRLVQGAVASAVLVTLPAFAQGDARRLRIGFQKGGGPLGILKAQGRLDQVLGTKGWSVSWHEFPAGPQLLEAAGQAPAFANGGAAAGPKVSRRRSRVCMRWS